MMFECFCGPQDSDSESIAVPPVMDETYEPGRSGNLIPKRPNNPIPTCPLPTPARSVTPLPEVPVTSNGSISTYQGEGDVGGRELEKIDLSVFVCFCSLPPLGFLGNTTPLLDVDAKSRLQKLREEREQIQQRLLMSLDYISNILINFVYQGSFILIYLVCFQ